jgi:hypothetical protein
MTSETEALEEVEGTVTYDLISDVGIANSYTLGLGWVHKWQIGAGLRRMGWRSPRDTVWSRLSEGALSQSAEVRCEPVLS